jgi:hypothetical protein
VSSQVVHLGNQSNIVGAAAGASDSDAALSTETIFNARLAVRLVNKAGDVIWATSQDTTGSKYRTATADLADKTVAQLMRDFNRATTPAATNSPGAALTPASRNQIVRNAKTILVTVDGDKAMEAEITKKLLAWGRLGLVSSSGKADLSLGVTQTGKFNMVKYGSAVTAAAELRDSESGSVIWSTTKGGFWSMSGASTRQVGGQIASDLVKFLDVALNQNRKPIYRPLTFTIDSG